MHSGQAAKCKHQFRCHLRHLPFRRSPNRAHIPEDDHRKNDVVHHRFHRREYSTGRTAAASAPVPAPQDDSTTQKHFWRIVLPTGLTLLLCNMDRICMSVAILPMAAEFGWSPSLQGLAQAAFLWGYMVTQLVGGSLADQLGGKTVIANAIKVFSIASLILPLAIGIVPPMHTLAVVIVSRFLVGLGEGFVLPSMNALVATSVPTARKASALGAIFSFFHCGNLVGLALSPIIISAFNGWASLFVIFGLLGAPLLVLWQSVMPSTPQHTSAKQTAPTAPPVATLLRTQSALAIIVANFVNHWGYFIFLSWMPSYFATVHGLNMKASALMAWLPWCAMALGSSLAGLLADSLVRKHPVLAVRKAVQVAAFLGPAAALLSLTAPGISAATASSLFFAALGFQALGQAGFVANMSDIAPTFSGKLFGLCNTFGSAAGIIGVSAAGWLYDMTGTFDVLFRLSAALYVIGALVFSLWARADPIALGRSEQ